VFKIFLNIWMRLVKFVSHNLLNVPILKTKIKLYMNIFQIFNNFQCLQIKIIGTDFKKFVTYEKQ